MNRKTVLQQLTQQYERDRFALSSAYYVLSGALSPSQWALCLSYWQLCDDTGRIRTTEGFKQYVTTAVRPVETYTQYFKALARVYKLKRLIKLVEDKIK